MSKAHNYWHKFTALRPRRLTSGPLQGKLVTGKIARRWDERRQEWRYARYSAVFQEGSK